MAFVLDASMTMSWCFADESTPYGRQVLAALLDSYAEVPALWPFEIANVLAINEKRQRITEATSQEFLQTLSGLDIRIDHSSSAVEGKALLPLVRRYGLTAYDAAYLELAKRKGLPLASFDKELIEAAAREGIVLVGQQT
jgi:predicted nucleic acid-binding protein